MDAERGESRRRGLSHRERRVPQRVEQRVGRRGDLGRARVHAGDREYLPEDRERAPSCILRVVTARTRRLDPDTRADDGPADVATLIRGVASIITRWGVLCF